MGHSEQYLQKVETAARRGMDHLADRVDSVRLQVARASDRTVGYVQDRPVRSALMALAVGTLVFAVVRMLGSRDAAR
ncbi:hypothetical protein [Pelomonas cellulosilytica]|uniref:DUF3618 domain-containing protein n=1 Tax=Pelomonas cellulosilytica TaxID=2906762 RepID=A0ABS8XR00_9BURK|nr:hypothetical protein [Pelomonas sp. P8]MCE4553094.1 hypothetical protein [Pelomonas sp. P8]